MPLLVSIPTLAIIAREEIAPDDPFALLVCELASGIVCDEARHPEWETAALDSVPRAARRIALAVAKRTFQNPDLVVQEGNIGPLGGDRVAAAQALGMELSEAEEEDLFELRGESPGSAGGLWILPTTNPVQYDDVAYLFDDSGSDWGIPYGGFETEAFVEPGDVIR